MTTLFGQKRKGRRLLLFAEAVFLFVGFISLGWAGYMTGQRLLSSSWQDYRFEEALQGREATLTGYAKYLFEGVRPHGEGEQPAMTTGLPSKSRKLKIDELIGRIEIPRVKISAVVKEGVDPKILDRAVGHVPSTALPGEIGNVGVAAHRDTFFRGLRNIRKGDGVRVVTLAGTYVYKVDDMKIVWPKNVEVLDRTPDSRLTLVTCYPFNYVGSAPKRFIVQAKQVDFEAQTTQVEASSTRKSGS